MWLYLAPVLGTGIPVGALVDASYNWEVLGLNEALATAASKYH